MVTPVTSSYAQQPGSLQQNSQNQPNTGVRGDNRTQVQENFERQDTRPIGTSASESQNAETRNNGQEQRLANQANQNDFQSLISQDARRGSVVDITV